MERLLRTLQRNYDLDNFTVSDMTGCSAELRRLGSRARSMEEAARFLINHFYCRFVNPGTGQKSFILARFFAALPYHKLDDELQASVMSVQ